MSSTSKRAAVFLPTPGTRQSGDVVVGQHRRSSPGACTERMASASAGPTPWAPSRASKHGALIAGGEGEADRVPASSRTWWWIQTNTASPGPPRRAAVRPGGDPVADAAHLHQRLTGRAPDRSGRPVANRSPRELGRRSRPSSGRPPSGDGGVGQVAQRDGGRRRRRRRGAGDAVRRERTSAPCAAPVPSSAAP